MQFTKLRVDKTYVVKDPSGKEQLALLIGLDFKHQLAEFMLYNDGGWISLGCESVVSEKPMERAGKFTGDRKRIL